MSSPLAASGAEPFQSEENSSWPSTDAFPRTTAEIYNAIPEFASSTNNYPAEQHPDERRVILIGIAGASGVGKSALARMLAKKLQPHTQIIHADSCFYHAHQRNARTDGRSLDWESPDAVDFTIIKNISSECETMSKRESGCTGNSTSNVVIVEGFLLFCDADICKMYDACILAGDRYAHLRNHTKHS